MEIFAVIRGSLTIERGPATRPRIYPRRFHESYRTRRRRRMVPRFVSRNGFRPFIWNCGAALSRRASRASWSGRLLDDASDQYRRPASHWPLLLGAVENRPGDDGQEEAGGCLRQGEGGRRGWRAGEGRGDGSKGANRADLPSSILPQPPAILCDRFSPSDASSSLPSTSLLPIAYFPSNFRFSHSPFFSNVSFYFSFSRPINYSNRYDRLIARKEREGKRKERKREIKFVLTMHDFSSSLKKKNCFELIEQSVKRSPSNEVVGRGPGMRVSAFSFLFSLFFLREALIERRG